MEVAANLQADLMKFINAIKDSHEQLLTVFQRLPEVVLPTLAQVEAIIPELFSSIGVELINIPFSLQSATSSFLKTIYKVQPSNNSQQFKDGVLWADCMGLLDADNVTLVTADKAFYAGHKYENGLAKNLQGEASQHPNTIRVLSTLAELLDTLPKTIPFDDKKLVEAALIAAESNVTSFLVNGFEIGEPARVTRNAFATENPDKLFFECSIAIPCPDITGLDREDALMVIDADGLYSCEREEFDELGMKSATFKFCDENGEELERRGVWVRAGGTVMGHREVTSVIREKLHDTNDGK